MLFDMYYQYLVAKYEKVVVNEWAVLVIVALALIAYFGYAFYCTSRGYTFAGINNIFRGQIQIKCVA